jgi:hypothetical protein
MLELTLVLNALWFFGGFHLFSIRSHIFAKIIVPKEHRDTPVMDILIASGKFLGGFNFAFFVLNVVLLLGINVFTNDKQWAILLMVMAVAHGSQFIYNVPVALQNCKGKGVWQVKGLMRFIFVTDFSLMSLNAGLAVYCLIS